MSLTVSLMGWRQSGKSTFAGYLAERHGFLVVQFADALYAEAAAAVGLTVPEFARFKAMGHETPFERLALKHAVNADYVECVIALRRARGDTRSREELLAAPRSYRRTLQTYGTDFRRSQDKNYWVNRLAARLAQEPDRSAVITDVRHQNELELGQSLGPTIRIHNEQVDREMRAKIASGDPSATHVSETQVINSHADLVLVNEPNRPEAMYEAFIQEALSRGWDLEARAPSRVCRAA